ncbi:polysaccharide deacetylase family protein [Phenylobacterium sp.]|jgi:peptidoglycan/xylan/chitin deacetylase (PgdA/CDA1 family)|uniref:oligosaccharide deacetylase HfsH n=1 Tax=Phenylobacterium sp. TaxID=1871053 RepID=UPI002F3F1692
MAYAEAYQPDRSLKGKLRRRAVRLVHRRPLAASPGRPMISFSFDDAPATAARAGAAALEARGLRGTFYVAAGLAGGEAPMGVCAEGADYRRLAGAGHEIACHTFSHLDCGRASGPEALADVAANARALAAWGAPAPETFAYPYGDVAVAAKQALSPRFRLLRALHHGLVEQGADLAQAPAVGIEGGGGEAVARRWMAAALRRKAWLVLYTHDVREDPSPWGCTPAVLARLIDHAVSEGFEVVTVVEGARKLSGDA